MKAQTLFPPTSAKVEAGALVTLPAQSFPLSVEQLELFDRCELRISDCLLVAKKNLREAGRLLDLIKEKDLYKIRFGTWEAYLEKRWKLNARQALRLRDMHRNTLLIEEAHQLKLESVQLDGSPGNQPVPQLVVPTRESRSRPLQRLADPDRAGAWDEAVEASGGKEPTAKQVLDAVAKHLPQNKAQTVKPEADNTSLDHNLHNKFKAITAAKQAIEDLDNLLRGHKAFRDTCASAMRSIQWIERRLLDHVHGRKPRKLSPAARVRLSQAARKRWSRVKELGARMSLKSPTA